MDFDAAFRNIHIHLNDLPLLGFTLDDLYFINSSMAFGARSSCKIFEEFATSVQWILDNETNSTNSSHYLDDFIMVHASSTMCAYYMSTLQDICNFIGAPLSPDKMEGPMQITCINFLGLTLNFLKQDVQIPLEKVQKAITQIDYLLSTQYVNNKNLKGKVQVKSIQKLTGLLNFICRAVPCGRPFLCRLYNLQAKAYSPHTNASHPKPKPHHKVRLDKGSRQDPLTWKQFLSDPAFQIHREVKFLQLLAGNQGPQIFADATGSALLGFGCVYPEKGLWAHGRWPLFLQASNSKHCPVGTLRHSHRG